MGSFQFEINNSKWPGFLYARCMSQWALITGASQGIGYELANLFAADGYNLVLVARDRPRLDSIAAELSSRHGVKVHVLPKDLASSTAAREIFEAVGKEEIPISVLVNNAGFGAQGAFGSLDWKRHQDLIQVNITSLVELTYRFLQPMLVRKEGRIVNLASTASFVPGPNQAMYYASKSFVHSFSQALGCELAGTGVSVTAIHPGMTNSQFHRRAGMKEPEGWVAMSAAAVARKGYRALMRRRGLVVTGWQNKLLVFGLRLIPVRWAASGAGRVNASRAVGQSRG